MTLPISDLSPDVVIQYDEQINDLGRVMLDYNYAQMREQARQDEILILAKLAEGYRLEDLELCVEMYTGRRWIEIISADERWCRWLEQNH